MEWTGGLTLNRSTLLQCELTMLGLMVKPKIVISSFISDPSS